MTKSDRMPVVWETPLETMMELVVERIQSAKVGFEQKYADTYKGMEEYYELISAKLHAEMALTLYRLAKSRT